MRLYTGRSGSGQLVIQTKRISEVQVRVVALVIGPECDEQVECPFA